MRKALRLLRPMARLASVLCILTALPLSGVAAPAGRYGAPLRFDPPPVDINQERPDDAADFSEPSPLVRGTEGQGEPVGTALASPQAEEGGTAPNVIPDAGEKADASTVKPVRLFGTVEFRGPLQNIPKWERVEREEKKMLSFGGEGKARMPPGVAARWEALREKIQDLPLMEQVKAVNNFFNQWPYKTDMANWGIEDYWATPSEFVRKSGDCEDYAIAKYYALRNLGVPASQLRVVALKDAIRNLGHAVLAVYIGGDAYILDNLSNMVLVHSRLTNYAPQFSVNEEFRWVHIKPLNTPR
jgi:predicted transglutaminase-like cysteine proteinase